MELSVQTFENLNEKKAIDLINNIKQFIVVHSSQKSKNSVQKKVLLLNHQIFISFGLQKINY